MEKSEFLKLIDKHLAGKTDEVEQAMLTNYLDSFQPGQKNTGLNAQETEAPADLGTYGDEAWRKAMLEKIMQKNSPVPVRRIVRYAAAAAILLLVAAAWWIWAPQKNIPQELAGTKTGNTEVKPGTTGAILTLEDGTTVALDTVRLATVVMHQAGSKVVGKDGKLVYEQSTDLKPEEVKYNTLTTPRGLQVRMQLPDGTEVWLNAGSSIRYPTAFVGTERKVEITGEAYFEVTKNATQPFIVAMKGDNEVKVLGTNFNVNCYDDEPFSRTTLLEGKIALYNTKAETPMVTLSPGQEARIANGDIRMYPNPDVNSATSWIRGMFSFKSADLKMVLRQVCRWYDLDVEYRDNVTARFSGSVYRSASIGELLKVISYTSNVKFSREGRKLLVMPADK